MNKSRFILHTLAAALLVVVAASAANAQATRTWVSGVGDDVNPCSRTAPCKTYAGAISKTAAGGEISTLDPGGFGAVTITKSIVIEGTTGQGYGSILASGVTGVNVNDSATATPGNIKVTLRNLSINGAGTTLGINGINFSSGKELNVIDCFIQNFSGVGIKAEPTTDTAADTARVFIKGTDITRITGDGISIGHSFSGNQTIAVIEDSSVTESGNGVHVKSNGRAGARNCVFSLNNIGVFAEAVTAGTFGAIEVWTSQISFNTTNGVKSGNGGNAGLSSVTIAQNQIDRNASTAVLISTGGAIFTFSNNSILDNGTNGCAGCSPVGPGN